jgi:uncharacterized protein YecE (DUF72 family)
MQNLTAGDGDRGPEFGRNGELPLDLGCPVWACDSWADIVYPPKTPRSAYLQWYAKSFNSVEGNSTFWAIPSPRQTALWAASVGPDFRFALKFPRVITHDARLRDCQSSLAAFIDAAKPLAERGCLGTCFIQLPPTLAVDELPLLQRLCDPLPDWMPIAVEPRHASFYDQAAGEAALDRWLRDLRYDRVLFDSRPLYSLPARTDCERVSQTRKPRTPLRQTVTGRSPFLRLIGRDDPEEVERFLAEWSEPIAKWVDQGLRPVVFVHAPNDRNAPQLVRQLWRNHLAPRLGHPIAELPTLPARPPQLSWF